jgi:hypothetical protein
MSIILSMTNVDRRRGKTMSAILEPHIPTTTPDDAELTRQHQRFNWFAERMQRWLDHYGIEELTAFLEEATDRRGQREKALVLLALTDDDEARRILEDFDTSAEPRDFRLLHRVALQHATRDRVG